MEIPRFWRWHQKEVWPFARSSLRAQMVEGAKKLREAEENSNNNGGGGEADNTATESVVALGLLEKVTTAE